MTCLACGAPPALEAIASPHALGALLCVTHLIVALSGDNRPLSGGSEPRVPRDRCWGLRLTCPHPATWQALNARYCPEHAPPPTVVTVAKARPSDSLAEDGMAAAILAALQGLGGVILSTTSGYYGEPAPLEGP